MPVSTFVRREMLLLVLLLSCVLGIMGCERSVGSDALQEILDRGTIRIGVAEFVPWTMRTQSGDLIGYEIDLANKLAKDLEVKPDIKVYEWEKIIAALQNGEIDVIAGGMAITPGRALQVNFTLPVAKSGVGLATNTRMTRHIKTLEQLNSKNVVIATVADTLAFSVSQALFDRANVKVFRTNELAEKEILEGRAHAYLASMPEVRFLTLQNSSKLDLPMAEPLIASSEALAVRKGEQELLNFLNAWVVARETDKWLGTTRDYWFDTLDWVTEATK